MISSVLIAINWFFFIFAIQTNNATEASLGYFIMPLVTVVWGLIIFKEKLSHIQWFAVLLAAIAVLILTIGLASAPWIALTLAVSFSFYAVLKKRLKVPPMISVTAEVLILIPLALLIILSACLAEVSAFLLGHPSLGLTINNLDNPKLSIALAAIPIFSES